MAKLNHEQIKEEVAKYGYSLVDDSGYTNMNSMIKIRCPKGHLIEASLHDIRLPSFTCPICNKNIDFVNPKNVPSKNGYRIIAFDQATEKFGLSIFDQGELVFYNLFVFKGDLINRLAKIKKLVEDIVIKEWKPDYIIMEDIQYQQNGLITFKTLAMLLGILEELCLEHNIAFEVVSPNVWRKYAGTCGKVRREEKLLSVAKVKEKYNIKVSDDIAEAILIGSYAARTLKIKYDKAF